MPADTLYEDDIVAWSEQQAQAIRDLVRARSDLSNVIDWVHIAEEIDSVGQEFFFKFVGLTRQFLIHLAKALSAPNSPSFAHWRTEAQILHDDATTYFTPAMRRRLDLDAIWGKALRQARLSLAENDQLLATDLSEGCPLTLDELLDPDLDLDRAVALVRMRQGRGERAA